MFAKASTERDPPSKPSPSGCRRPDAPESSYGPQERDLLRLRRAGAPNELMSRAKAVQRNRHLENVPEQHAVRCSENQAAPHRARRYRARPIPVRDEERRRIVQRLLERPHGLEPSVKRET